MIEKESLREDSLNSLAYLLNVLHESFLSSKLVDVQEKAIVLLSRYLKHDIVFLYQFS